MFFQQPFIIKYRKTYFNIFPLFAFEIGTGALVF